MSMNQQYILDKVSLNRNIQKKKKTGYILIGLQNMLLPEAPGT